MRMYSTTCAAASHFCLRAILISFSKSVTVLRARVILERRGTLLMRIELPQFAPNKKEREWVQTEKDTAQFIQTLWNAADEKHRNADFISLLVSCGWLNDGKDRESTRRWRNRNIADYLQVAYKSDEQLSQDLARTFPRLKQPARLVQTNTGITHYYRPLRPATLEFVASHFEQIAKAFRQASSTRNKTDDDIRRVVKIITDLGFIRTLGREVSPLNGLTPTLACLDPTQTFPIMNSKTDRLLSVIAKERDASGAVSLSHLIGHNGIKNSFDLDVYAATADFRSIETQRKRRSKQSHASGVMFRDVGLKSENDSFARISAARKRIRKLHNELTNRFRNYLMWRYTLQESEFDALIADWKPGRKLLIEAKTASDGLGGRVQIRQAIGQLFDYRHKFFPLEKELVDLALLLPAEPSSDICALMKSLDIEVIWFKGKKLQGTIKL
jgi:hypothetical protein